MEFLEGGCAAGLKLLKMAKLDGLPCVYICDENLLYYCLGGGMPPCVLTFFDDSLTLGEVWMGVDVAELSEKLLLGMLSLEHALFAIYYWLRFSFILSTSPLEGRLLEKLTLLSVFDFEPVELWLYRMLMTV